MSRVPAGFSLIDVIVGTALMLILFLALFGVLRASLVLSSIAKAKAAATELATTQMEYLHGLSYDAIGTVGGIPAGLIAQNATSTVDGVAYGVRTYIQYTDDPADGLGASDTNGITTDYKTGKVTVSYTLYGITKSVTLVSIFEPPGIESSTGGGTLSLHIVDKNNNPVGDAVVQIIDASTTPTVNFTTLSDSSGYVVIGGAATSSQFQIYASKSGYSSAQTYARAGQNANPTPGYLTVTKNQTTSATFAIDLLGSLVMNSFSPATTTTFTDLFTSAANLASQTNTQVSGGALTLLNQGSSAGYTLSGTALSTALTPNYLDGWGILQASLATSTGTSVVIHVDTAAGTPLPESALPGNTAGFTTFPVSLTGLSTTTYPSLVLEADLTTNSTSTTPSLLDWSLSHTEGPTPLPNLAFTLTGAKTIGTTAGGATIPKTIFSDTTGAGGSKTESLEWDAYTPSIAGAIEICQAPTFALLPGATLSESIISGTLTATTLPVVVVDSTSAPIPLAKIVLTKSGYAATVLTSACGLSYFNNLTNGTYSATVSAAGHTTTTFPNISVSGHTATSTLTLP